MTPDQRAASYRHLSQTTRALELAATAASSLALAGDAIVRDLAFARAVIDTTVEEREILEAWERLRYGRR